MSARNAGSKPILVTRTTSTTSLSTRTDAQLFWWNSRQIWVLYGRSRTTIYVLRRESHFLPSLTPSRNWPKGAIASGNTFTCYTFLRNWGFISVPEGLYERSFGRDRIVSGWTGEARELEIKEQKCSETKVVFIQPKRGESDVCGFKYIYFEDVANIVQRHGDLGCMFANFLRQWTKEAGSPDPRKIHRS